jgi:hypothetical protein
MRDPYFGPIVPVRTQLRVAPWFILIVVALGVLEDHGIINLTGQAQSVIQQHHESQPGASARATADIPPGYLAAYRRAAGTCPHLTWSLLAGVGKVESDHGRVNLPGVRSGANFAGAAGPMQLGTGGKAGPTWQRYGDGVPGHVYQIGPASKAAARKLCNDGVRRGDIPGALYAYNPSWSYVAKVRAAARRYQRRG